MDGVENRERAWHQQCGADTLEQPRHLKRQDGRRQCAPDRRGCEQRKARKEHTARSEAVAQQPGSEQEHRKAERVGIDHPRQRAEARAELSPDRRQRHIDDGDVQLHDDESETACQQNGALGSDSGRTHAISPLIGAWSGDTGRYNDATPFNTPDKAASSWSTLA